jgi:hypothetical protein
MKEIGNYKYTDEQMIKINEYKTLINKMQKYQDEMYKELLQKELTLQSSDDNEEFSKKDEEFLFEYIFNDYEITNDEKTPNE